MKNKLEELIQKIEESEEILENNRGELNDYLLPILNILGVQHGFVNNIFNNNKTKQVLIEYRWINNSQSYDKNIIIPSYIFEADNPIETTKNYKLQQEIKNNAIRKEETKALIQKLQQEINDE